MLQNQKGESTDARSCDSPIQSFESGQDLWPSSLGSYARQNLLHLGHYLISELQNDPWQSSAISAITCLAVGLLTKLDHTACYLNIYSCALPT
jgi:hypothetical protein